MLPERFKRNQPPSLPEWPVDLDGLQARSSAGEPVDVYKAFADAVTPDMYEARFQLRSVDSLDSYSRIRATNRILRLTTGKLFVDTFEKAVPASPDIVTFRWRLNAALGNKTQGLDYYYSDRPESDTGIKLGRGTRTALSIVYLTRFCAEKPELTGPAIDTWEELLSDMYKDGGGIIQSNIFESVILEAERRLLKGTQEPERSKYAKDLLRLKDALWSKFILNPAIRTKIEASPPPTENIKLLATDLELTPIDRLGLPNLLTLESALVESESQKPEVQLIKPSLNATVNFVGSVANLKTESKDPVAAVIDKKFQTLKQRDEVFGYSDMTEVANTITPLLKKIYGLELERLDPASIEDYPKAVDRIVSLIMKTGEAAMESTEKTPVFRAAAECVRLMAFKGVEHKLKQRVLSLEDFVMRYSNLSYEAQRNLAEELQQRRTETSIHQTYRELRTLHKNRAYFRKFSPGGMLR